MKVNIRFALSAIAAIQFSIVNACDCVQYNLIQSIQLTDLIISGQFIKGQNSWELSSKRKNEPVLYYTGMFVVKQVLKGNVVKSGDTLRVVSDFTDCSMLYQNNTNYLLFTSLKIGKIKTTVCSYSGILDEEETKRTLNRTKKNT